MKYILFILAFIGLMYIGLLAHEAYHAIGGHNQELVFTLDGAYVRGENLNTSEVTAYLISFIVFLMGSAFLMVLWRKDEI